MIKEAVGFGATIDEAKENAIKNLGAGELDDVQFDVVAFPKTQSASCLMTNAPSNANEKQLKDLGIKF